MHFLRNFSAKKAEELEKKRQQREELYKILSVIASLLSSSVSKAFTAGII